METKIDVLENVVIDNSSSNFNEITSLDFGGANVTFSKNGWGQFENSKCTNMTNGTLNVTKSTYYFQGLTALTSFTLDCPNLTDGSYMFFGCSNLQTFSANCSALTSCDGIFNTCENITDIQIIVPNALSGKSCADLTYWSKSLPYKYVDTIDDNLVRLVFTSTERT